MSDELFDLCKEVYDITGWQSPQLAVRWFDEGHPYTPIYSTDYLIDKLTERNGRTGLTLYHVHSTMSYEAFYAGKFFEYGTKTQHWDTQGSTPLEALLRLVIEVHKQGDKQQ